MGEPDADQDVALNVISIILAVFALFIIVDSTYRRIKRIGAFLRPQPTVHKLLPNAFRNTQLAWLCNLQAAAVVLESTSLSEYLIENGGPVIPGKQKDLVGQPRVIVESITSAMLIERIKFQDLPMLGILAVHFLLSMAAKKESE